MQNRARFACDVIREIRRVTGGDYPICFRVSATESRSVPLMSQEGSFRYSRDADCRVIELPYSGKDLSMILILPEAVDGLPRLERDLNPRVVGVGVNILDRHFAHGRSRRFGLSCQGIRNVTQGAFLVVVDV